MIYSTGGVGTDLLAIDAKTGESKVVGSFGYPGSAPLAFGTDGKLYTVTDSMRHENAQSQLETVDPKHRQGNPHWQPTDKTVRIMALGPGPDGGLYASGVMENRLSRIDPRTGVFIEVGPFKGGRDVMDFAINPQDGAMYATTPTALYRLDPRSAEPTEVTRYFNMPPSMMGIVFDRDGTLLRHQLWRGERALPGQSGHWPGREDCQLPGAQRPLGRHEAGRRTAPGTIPNAWHPSWQLTRSARQIWLGNSARPISGHAAQVSESPHAVIPGWSVLPSGNHVCSRPSARGNAYPHSRDGCRG